MRLPRATRRRATVYILVLSCALVVMIVGLSAVLAVRARRRALDEDNDFAAARHHARAAIDVGLYALLTMPDWRTRLPHGTWLGPVSLGRGAFTLIGVDPDDGDLTDAASDPLVLTGIGECGPARYLMQVTLTPPVIPLPALKTCLHAAQGIAVPALTSVTATGAPLSTNGTLSSAGLVTAGVEAGAVSAFPEIVGQVAAPAPAKTLPAAAVVADYAAQATAIPIASCTTSINGAVLSPASNPWGATNANGVYLIDTGGDNLAITGLRLVGTLVIRTGGGTVSIGPGAFCTPARADYPVLIVDGALLINLNSTLPLSELLHGMSFNPPGTPYEGGADSDVLDTYPNEIRGLVHVTGNLGVHSSSQVCGVLLCGGSAAFSGQIALTYDPQLAAAPPLGYTTYGTPVIVPGSWRQTVAAGEEAAVDVP